MGGSPSFPRTPLSKDVVAIVTGGNAGIGYEIAKWLAMLGATVIIACRNEERAKQAIERMQKDFTAAKNKKTEGVVDYDSLLAEYILLDCASLKSTMNFINTFKSSGRPLHILICNAGVAMPPQEYTEDGHELQFQVNYLSQFLLSLHLLPVMKATNEACRIILVSSDAHKYANFSIDQIEGREYNQQTFDRFQYYGRSKLYQIMQMFSMNRRLKSSKITVNCFHPGVVETDGVNTFQDLRKWVIFLRVWKCLGLVKSPYQGAISCIDAAVNPKYSDTRNAYFVDCSQKSVSSEARNEHHQEALWKYSMECLQEYVKDVDILT